MDRWMVAYVWALTLIGAMFLGNEIAMMQYESNRTVMNERLQACNSVLAGNIYAK